MELFFAILFELFFPHLFVEIEEITFSKELVDILTIITFLILLASFIVKPVKENIRILSRVAYVLPIFLAAGIAYENGFNRGSFFSLLLVYCFFSFMFSSIKAYLRFNGIALLTIFFALVGVGFKTIIPIHLIVVGFVLIFFGAFALTLGRNHFKVKIKQREQLLDFIFNNSSDGLLLIDIANNVIIELNDVAKRIFGNKKLIGVSLDLIKLGNVSLDEIKNNTKKSVDTEDGKIFIIEQKKIDFKNKQMCVIEIHEYRDLNELNKSSEFDRLRTHSEENYQYLFEENSSIICVVDRKGIVIDINNTLSELLQYSKEEVIGKNYTEFTAKEAPNRLEINKEVWNGKPAVFEKSIRKKNGQEVLVELVLRKGRYFGKEVFISNGRSIELRKKLESEVFNAYERYRNVSELSPIGFVITDKEGVIINTNRAFTNMLGYNYEELIGEKFLSFSFPDDAENKENLIQELLAGKKQIGEIEKRYLKKDGREIHTLLKMTIQKDSRDEPELIFAQIVDISSILQAQQELAISEKSYRDLFNNSNDLLYILDENTVFVDVNQSVINKYGYTKEEILGRAPDMFSAPDLNDLSYIFKQLELAWKGKQVKVLWWSIKKNGEIFPKELILRKGVYRGKNILMASGRDVSESYNYEKQLEEKERRYRHLFERNLAGVYRTARNGEILEYNSAFAKTLGFAKEEQNSELINAKKFYVNDEERERFLEKRHKNKFLVGERLILKRTDGSIINVLLNVSSIFDENNEFQYYEGSVFDITELVYVQEQLKESEKKHKQLIDSSSFGIIIMRKDKLVFANEMASKVMGYNSQQEMIGLDTKKLVFEKDINLYSFLFEKILEEEIPFSEYRIKKKNGETVDVEAKPILVDFENKKSLQISFIDISDKRKYEEAEELVKSTERFNQILKSQLKEKEILLKEVHHRVKNNLQVVSSILSLQSTYIDDEKTRSLLSESQNRIRSMALIHEKLYTTKDFSKISFSNYINNLAENIVGSYAQKEQNVELLFDTEELYLNLDEAIPCGLILNELISNCLKYAFKGRKEGAIKVQLKEEKNEICLSIIDNGVGFPEQLNFRETESLGLQLVNTLVEQLEGNINLINGKGTEFNIRFNRGD